MKIHTFKTHIEEIQKSPPLDTEIIQFLQWYKHNNNRFKPRSVDDGQGSLLMLQAPHSVRRGFLKIWEQFKKSGNKFESL